MGVTFLGCCFSFRSCCKACGATLHLQLHSLLDKYSCPAKKYSGSSLLFLILVIFHKAFTCLGLLLSFLVFAAAKPIFDFPISVWILTRAYPCFSSFATGPFTFLGPQGPFQTTVTAFFFCLSTEAVFWLESRIKAGSWDYALNLSCYMKIPWGKGSGWFPCHHQHWFYFFSLKHISAPSEIPVPCRSREGIVCFLPRSCGFPEFFPGGGHSPHMPGELPCSEEWAELLW